MKLKQSLLLLLTAAIWGVAFVAQSAGMDYVGPLTFNCIRSILGGLVLLPVIFFMDRAKAGKRKGEGISSPAGPAVSENRKNLWLGGICCGTALCLASNFQQFGIQYTTVGKAGFITACYIVIVPFGGLILGKKVGAFVWGAVALAVAGLYRLCIPAGGGILDGINQGDLLLLVCAFLFTIHILVIDHFSALADGVKMSCIQFFVAGILSGVGMLLTEEVRLDQIAAAWLPILYAGIFSSGVGYTLQIVGQKGMNPTIASLILSLESSISVLAGWALLGQSMSLRELSGCGLMFLAIILAQIPMPGGKRERKTEMAG